jgi:hypothetical protein
VELALLRSRAFSGAFVTSILYYAGFGAYVLSSVEFLTGEWRYSAVRAGLAIAPGPLLVLPVARLAAPAWPRGWGAQGGWQLSAVSSAPPPCACGSARSRRIPPTLPTCCPRSCSAGSGWA